MATLPEWRYVVHDFAAAYKRLSFAVATFCIADTIEIQSYPVLQAGLAAFLAGSAFAGIQELTRPS